MGENKSSTQGLRRVVQVMVASENMNILSVGSWKRWVGEGVEGVGRDAIVMCTLFLRLCIKIPSVSLYGVQRSSFRSNCHSLSLSHTLSVSVSQCFSVLAVSCWVCGKGRDDVVELLHCSSIEQ